MLTIAVLPEATITFLLLLARLGAIVMLVPGLGEAAIPARIRLSLALVFAFVFYPVLAGSYPAGLADEPGRLVFLLVMEVILGLAIGLLARMLMSAAQVAGAAIAYQMGLGFAQSVDPTMGQQGAVVGGFLAVCATALVFIANLHHLAIIGLVDSYALFPPGAPLMAADFAEGAVATVARAFSIGMQLAAPFIAFGLIYSLGLGVLSRLMPQLQVFFIGMPASILVGLVLLALLIGIMLTVFTGHVEDGLMRFLVR